MRGLSPTVSFVLLIALVAASTLLLYYWVVGQGNAPAVSQSKIPLQVDKYNSTMLKVTNIGATNSTSLTKLDTSTGDCTFPAATILRPGVTYNCSLSAPASGEISVWATGIDIATVQL